MKKTFLYLVLCLLCALSYGQTVYKTVEPINVGETTVLIGLESSNPNTTTTNSWSCNSSIVSLSNKTGGSCKVTGLSAGTAEVKCTVTAVNPTSGTSYHYLIYTVTVNDVPLEPGTWSGNTLTIGDNATSTTNRAPYNNYWTYSTSQMLYSPAEIGKSGTINSIAFKVASSSSFTTTDLKVYLGHKSSIFSSTGDYMTSSNLTLVYSGSPTLGQSTGWETLTFNQGSFNYNGTDNLVVVVTTKSSKYNTSLKYYCYAGSGYVLSRGNDSTTGYGDITSTSYAYSASTERPAIRMVFAESSSPTSINLNTTSVSLEVGGTKQLTATVLPSGASQSVTWSVISGSSVASVSSTGLVTAKATGTATVRATSSVKSSVYKDCTVTVTSPISGGTTVTIGGSATSSIIGVPYGSLYFYSTAQMLYTPTEIGRSGTINGIAFKVADSRPSSHSSSQVKVYLGHKSSNFSSENDYVASSDLTLVYSGTPKLGLATGWETIVFNQGTFTYNGTDNLVVVVTRKNSMYTNSYYCYSGSGYTLYRHSDNDSTYGDVTNTSNSYSPTTWRPAVQLGFGVSYTPTISLNTTSISLGVGETKQLTAAVLPNGISQQSVTWSVVSGSGVASVSSSGLVTAQAAGTATIRAALTLNGSVFYSDCAVTVKNPPSVEPGIWFGDTLVTIVGDSVGNINVVPYANGYRYSTIQMIYTPTEIGKSGMINSIAFKVASSSSFATSEVKIYLGHKSSKFSGTGDYVTSSNLTLVYSGSPTLGQATGWETLKFNQGTFTYNGTDNLVVVVTRKSGGDEYSLRYSYYYTGIGYTLLRRSDGSSGYGDVTNTSYSYSTSTYRPAIQMTLLGGAIIAINSINFPDVNFRSYLLSQSYGSDGVLTQDEINGVTSLKVGSKKISSLKGIEHFTALTYLSCYSNRLTTLDVSKNTALKELSCYSNQLTTLDVSKNTALTSLSCESNQLTTLDVSKNTALTSLSCGSNQLTTLDVSKNTALTSLSCGSNQLTTLDVSKNTALTSLSCGSNQLTTLDVSKNTALTSLSCGSNQLTTLDVSKNTALTSLSCGSNQLTTLDVSKNTALTSLYCESSQLTTLDVTKNTALKRIDCSYNQLATLDVSKNTALIDLTCCVNNINGLNMDNLIAGLRQNNTNSTYEFNVISTYIFGNNNEGNVCTKKQVAAVKAKGWIPNYFNYNEGLFQLMWDEYEGSEDIESLESISLPESIQLSVGETQTLTPVFTPASAAMGVTWSSEDETIATVDEFEGIVTAVSPGTTTIYVVADDAEHMASCQVTVTEKVLHDGDTFAANTVEGVKMTYTVISAANKTCLVGTNSYASAIKDNIQGSITIPEEVSGFSVTSIGNSAFNGCSGLTFVTIPNSVTSIGERAFRNCSGLTFVTIPNSVTSIGERAFQNCSGLTSITIGSGMTTIGYDAFAGCSNLASITIPESVIYMENYTFDDTPWFENQPDGLVYAGKVLYDYKGRMPEGTHIDIMEGTLAIAGFAFEKCGNLTSVTIPNSVLVIGNNTFSDGANNITSVTIGSGVKEIGEEAFSSCRSLTTVTIPKNVESIGENAFYGCSGLTSITSEIKVPFAINKNVFQYYDDNSNTYKPLNATLYVPYGTKVLYEAASGWNQFTNIVEMEEESSEVIEYDGLYYRIAQSDEINAAIGQEVLSANVEVAVVVEAPRGHKYHGDIVIPASITYENNTYAVVAIDECAFAEYKEIELTSVIIPNSVVYIAEEAFVESSTLERVEIPNSVKFIGEDVFGDCESLSEIVSYIQEPFAINNDVFRNIANDATLYVPFGTKALYEATAGWNSIANILEMEPTEIEVTDISQMDNVVYVENVEGFAGNQVTLSVRMKNSVAAQGFGFNMYLPDSISFVTDTNGKPLATLSSERKTEDMNVFYMSDILQDGSLKVAATCIGSSFLYNEGEIVSVTVKLSDQMAPGIYPIILREVTVTDVNSNGIDNELIVSTITIPDYILGDVNGSGKVDVTDLTSVANYMFDNIPSKFNFKAADVSKPYEKINVSDLSGIANIMFYGTVNRPSNARTKVTSEREPQ